jgi:hypothetical protein
MPSRDHHPVIAQVVEAEYTPQTVPHYVGNKLIEALPPPLDFPTAIAMLTDRPSFHESERALPTEERFARTLKLLHFMIPMARHVHTACLIDSLIRESYVGKNPVGVNHVAMLQEFYRTRKQGLAMRPDGQFSAALCNTILGVSGSGKSVTVERSLAMHPQAIRHSSMGVTQLVFVVLQCPANGATVAGLAVQFFAKVDELLGTSYRQLYTGRGANEDTLSTDMASVAHRHCLGVLVLEEIQNLAKANKNEEGRLSRFIRLLVNKLKNALLMIGTNLAYQVLQRDFSEARRATGITSQYFDRLVPHWRRDQGRAENGLPRHSVDAVPATLDEFVLFIKELERYQWIRRPIVFDYELQETFFRLSQGVPDLLIKLYVSAQRRAMLDGTETITAELLRRTYNDHFSVLEPMLHALASGDPALLGRFDDLTPLHFDAVTLYQEAQLEASASRQTGESSNVQVVSRVAAALRATGTISDERAEAVAREVSQEEGNVLRATKKALRVVEPPARRKASSGEIGESHPAIETLPVDDVRRLYWEAKRDHRAVADVLMEAQEDQLHDLLEA